MSETSNTQKAAPIVDVNGNGVEDYKEPQVVGGILKKWATRYSHTVVGRALKSVFSFLGL